MSIDIYDFIEKISPHSITDVLDSELLEKFLHGFSFGANTGICILFPSDDSDAIDGYKRMESYHTVTEGSESPICKLYHETTPTGNRYCSKCDVVIAKKYFKSETTDPKTFFCHPLRLWNISLPIRIKDEVVAVLISGRIIVDFESYNENSTQHQVKYFENDIEKKIPLFGDDRIKTDRPHKKQIKEHIRMYRSADRLISQVDSSYDNLMKLNNLRSHAEEFIAYRNLLEKLVNTLHEQKVTEEEQKLLHEIRNNFTKMNTANRKDWLNKCGNVLCKLLKLTCVENIHFYERMRSRFKLVYTTIHSDYSDKNIPARETIQAKEILSIMVMGEMKEFTSEEFSPVDIAIKNNWESSQYRCYLSEKGSHYDPVSSFLVIDGIFSEETLSFWQDLSDIICRSSDETILLEREKKAEISFGRKVNYLGHDLRTPLHSLGILIHKLENNIVGKKSSREQTEKISENIDYAGTLIESLLNENSEKIARSTSFDYISVLNDVIKLVTPVTHEKEFRCDIRVEYKPDAELYVDGVEFRVRRALVNLMENAIKYSFHGLKWSKEPYYIKITNVISYNNVYVTISNYGIGIPKNKLAEIENYGTRLGIIDTKDERKGHGIGLPFSFEVYNDHGGWITVNSNPSKRATEKDIAEYHRYITTVEAVLPLSGVQNVQHFRV